LTSEIKRKRKEPGRDFMSLLEDNLKRRELK